MHEALKAPPEQGEELMEAIDHTVINLIIFVLAIFVGYHVVWTSRRRCTRR